MTATRLEHGVRRPAAVAIEVDGVRVDAYPGESVATALLAAGVRAFRRTP
jgi:D-hydroxyproline dehydrogenase subunit gamma